MIQRMLAIWSLVPLFSKTSLKFGSSLFMYCWSLAWIILNITMLVGGMSAIVWQFEHCWPLPFLGIGMKTDLFQSCGRCRVFLICWHIECSAFRASSFRIWKSSMGNPSPPLALFTVMLPKAHLTWQCFLEKPWISVETAQVLGVLHFYNRTTSHSWFKANFS